MDRGRTLIEHFEQNVKALAEAFCANINDYFFTEKDLHAYFYHLSAQSGQFQHKGHCLIHTEYPSPFKCSFKKEHPYVVQEAVDSTAQRAHIDCVLINPAFIDWLLDNDPSMRPLTGLGGERFSMYIDGFYDTYAAFSKATGEAVLLFALEFKFLRHTCVGRKYPLLEIRRDLAKLKLLKEFPAGRPARFDFVSRTKALVFVGKRMQKSGRAIGAVLQSYPPEEYVIVHRDSPHA